VKFWFWLANLKEREQFEDLAVNGNMILKWILNKENESSWSEFSLEWRLVAGCCGYGNETFWEICYKKLRNC